MVFCIECGTKNKDDAKFCFKCGKSITQLDNAQQGKIDELDASETYKEPNRSVDELLLVGTINELKKDIEYIKSCLNEIQSIPESFKENEYKPTVYDIKTRVDQIEKKLANNLKILDPSVVKIKMVKNPNNPNNVQIKTGVNKKKLKEIIDSYQKKANIIKNKNY